MDDASGHTLRNALSLSLLLCSVGAPAESDEEKHEGKIECCVEQPDSRSLASLSTINESPFDMQVYEGKRQKEAAKIHT